MKNIKVSNANSINRMHILEMNMVLNNPFKFMRGCLVTSSRKPILSFTQIHFLEKMHIFNQYFKLH